MSKDPTPEKKIWGTNIHPEVRFHSCISWKCVIAGKSKMVVFIMVLFVDQIDLFKNYLY